MHQILLLNPAISIRGEFPENSSLKNLCFKRLILRLRIYNILSTAITAPATNAASTQSVNVFKFVNPPITEKV